jgi:putative oxidoreductase
MKIGFIIVRSLLGLLFLFSSITFLLKLITPPEPTGTMKIFAAGLEASIYIMPTVKIIELLCGIAFLSGRFVPLASVVIAPIIVNIFFVHVFLAPEGLPVALFVVMANSFIVYYHRERYKSLLKM